MWLKYIDSNATANRTGRYPGTLEGSCSDDDRFGKQDSQTGGILLWRLQYLPRQVSPGKDPRK